MKKKSKGLSIKTTAALVIIVLLLGTGSTLLYYAFYKVAYMEVLDLQFEINDENIVGLNADPYLHFGKIPPSASSKKQVYLQNNFTIPLFVQIRIKGDAAPFISVDNNNFIMQPNESRSVYFFASVPKTFNTTGNFTGEAKIIFLRP